MRTLIILVLVGLILGGSAYFGYELYWKPRQLDREDKAAAESGQIPDYTLPIFEKAAALEQSGDIEGARAALGDFIRNYPDWLRNSPRRRLPWVESIPPKSFRRPRHRTKFPILWEKETRL